MKITTVFEQEQILALRVQDVSPSYINTLRRYASSKVPTMAIDFVEFKDNSGILYDEMVAHRMGMIPLTTDLKSYRVPDAEWNEPTGDPRVEVEMTLSVTAGKAATLVTAKDLKSKDKKIAPVHENMPITKLIEGQVIEATAIARMGIGEEHVKWSPGHIWYRHFPKIIITSQPKDAESFAQKFPGVFDVKSGKLAVAKDAAYHLPDTEIEGVQIDFEDGDYLLIIESWGQLPPKTILEQALVAYDDQLDEFSKITKEL